MADETLSVRKGTLGSTEMRYHELALQRWFYSTFFVQTGYPIPVVFATPMDAFGNFHQLFGKLGGPFAYLFNLKDEAGNPVYGPYPSNLRYPLISVFRRTWKMRVDQSYGLHQFRHMNWPTVSDTPDRTDLANVSTSFRPMGWDFRFQVDHYAMRPDTQAYFLSMLMRAFATGGGSLQTWIPVYFPALGFQKIRLYIDGDIENTTLEEPEDGKHTEFRTTVNLVLEGYSIDQNIQVVPALWKLILRSTEESSSPDELTTALAEQQTYDLRIDEANPTLDARPNVPASQVSLTQTGTYPPADIFLSGSEQPGAYLNFGFTSTNTGSPYFLGGIAPSTAYGVARVDRV